MLGTALQDPHRNCCHLPPASPGGPTLEIWHLQTPRMVGGILKVHHRWTLPWEPLHPCLLSLFLFCVLWVKPALGNSLFSIVTKCSCSMNCLPGCGLSVWTQMNRRQTLPPEGPRLDRGHDSHMQNFEKLKTCKAMLHTV